MPERTKERAPGVTIFLLFYIIVSFLVVTTTSLTYRLDSIYPLYLFQLFFAVTSAYLVFGLLKIKFSSWVLLYLQAGLVLLFSLFSTKLRLTTITIGTLNIVPLSYFLSRRVRKLYSEKKFNWLDQPERYLYEISIEMHSTLFYTFDISKSGAFIKHDVTDLQVGELLPITIHIDEVKIDCFAEVVWINRKTNCNYPPGFALKYNRVSRRDRQQLEYFIKLLQELKTEKLR